MNIEKLKDETIKDMQSKFEDDGSIGSFIQQIVQVSAETTALMLEKYHEGIKENE